MTDADAPISPATLRKLERASGELAAACLAVMEERQPWFTRLPASHRAGVMLVTQTGVANFVAWLGQRGESVRLTAEAFRIAPRDLARRLTLPQTVDLVRIATELFEQRLPPLAATEAERRALVEGVLRFGREIAFAAATVYAHEAETRAAWDARLEALVVDAVIRGPSPSQPSDALVSRASALGWDAGEPLRVVVGAPVPDAPDELLGQVRREADRSGQSILVGLQGARMVVLVSEPPGVDTGGDIGAVAELFGTGPVVVGPLAHDLAAAHTSAREALAGLRAAPGRPAAPRPVQAADLLPERALAGDPDAHRRLTGTVAALTDDLRTTLATYLEGGAVLEACARELFVHPNTVRYRLRRVSELTGLNPTAPRDAWVLHIALVTSHLPRS